jgi:hypothetical protein
MSDYLDNLVAKSLNRAEVVQPRPASLFEPSSPAGRLMADRSAADLETAQDERFSPETESEDPLTTPTPIKSSADTRLPRIGLGQSTGAVPPSPGGIADQDTHQHSLPFAGSQSIAPVLVPVTVRKASAATLLGSSGGAVLHSRHAERTESVFTPGTEHLKPSTLIPQERASSIIGPAAQSPFGSPSAQETAPTIKITIGRVDVRAVMPTPPAPRPASARRGPSLSLEDYLKQRDGGKR